MMDKLLRQQQIEMQQHFEDRQLERTQRQQEEAYDGQPCAAVGHVVNSPDYYQCIRASAALRLGEAMPNQRARPQIQCTTVGGDGMTDTTCN